MHHVISRDKQYPHDITVMLISIIWLRQHLPGFSIVNLSLFPFPAVFFGNESQNLEHFGEQGKGTYTHYLEFFCNKHLSLFPGLYLYSVIHFCQYGLMYLLWTITRHFLLLKLFHLWSLEALSYQFLCFFDIPPSFCFLSTSLLPGA